MTIDLIEDLHFLACRDLKKAEESIAKIKLERQFAKVMAMLLDLSSLTSVKSFAKEFQANFATLDILILSKYTICT